MGPGDDADGDVRLERQRAARGTAKDRLHATAVRLLAEATLDDLAAFATVGRLAGEAGLSSGAIYSAFPTPPTSERTAPQAVMRDAFLAFDFTDQEIVSGVAELFDSTIASPEDTGRLLEELADRVADPVVDGVRNPDRWAYTHLWLGAAIAKNDPEVTSMLQTYYHGIEEEYASVVAKILDSTGRAPIGDLGAHGIARVLIAAVDGAAIRLRIDPTVDGTLVSTILLGVFAALTRRIDEEDDLFARRIAVVGDGTPEPALLDAVATAVRRVEAAEGWPAVTLPRIAEMAGIAEVSLVAVYPTRHHLARIAWDDVVDRLGRRAASRSQIDLDTQVVQLVTDIAEAACSQRSLVSSMLTARLHDVSSVAIDDTVPDRAASLLASLLPADDASVAARATVDALLMGAAGSDVGADDLARLFSARVARVRVGER